MYTSSRCIAFLAGTNQISTTNFHAFKLKTVVLQINQEATDLSTIIMYPARLLKFYIFRMSETLTNIN